MWLEEHLETFVKPYLGSIPNIDRNHGEIAEWKLPLILALAATWKRAKQRSGGRKILLAGRDVWSFEILARMEGFPTTFRPDISGEVARNGYVKEDYSDYYLLDSGYQGSVPTALKIEHFDMVAYQPSTRKVANRADHQVFPLAKMYEWDAKSGLFKYHMASYGTMMKLACRLENAYKYWNQGVGQFLGTYGDKTNTRIVQSISNPISFNIAAQVTQHISAEVTRLRLL